MRGHGPGDASQFVGQGYRGFVVAVLLLDTHHPAGERIAALRGPTQQRSGTVDEGGSQFTVAVFADTGN